MAQPSKLTWHNPTVDKDGNPHTAEKNAGYSVSIDGAAPQGIALKFGESFDISGIVKTLKSGVHNISIAAVTTEGVTGDFSAPVPFTVHPQLAAPANVTVS